MFFIRDNNTFSIWKSRFEERRGILENDYGLERGRDEEGFRRCGGRGL